MEHESTKIHIQIGNNSYLISIEPNEELFFRQASKDINDLLNNYRRKHSQESSTFTDENLFVMIALQLMIENNKLKGNLNMEKTIEFSNTSQALIMGNIANRIQTLISDKKLTITEFCNITGIERSKLSFVLNQRVYPSLEMIIKIKQTFRDVDLNLLINGEE